MWCTPQKKDLLVPVNTLEKTKDKKKFGEKSERRITKII